MDDDMSDESMDYCDVEEEEEVKEVMKKRSQRFQKELWFNRHLPYAVDSLDEESERLLALIKRNMTKALVHKEMNPGIGICSAQLMW